MMNLGSTARMTLLWQIATQILPTQAVSILLEHTREEIILLPNNSSKSIMAKEALNMLESRMRTMKNFHQLIWVRIMVHLPTRWIHREQPILSKLVNQILMELWTNHSLIIPRFVKQMVLHRHLSLTIWHQDSSLQWEATASCKGRHLSHRTT